MINKAALRKEFSARRASISPEDKRFWDEEIYKRLVSFQPLRDASIVMTYMSFRNEVDTWKLVHYLLEHGIRVCIPRTDIISVNLTASEIFDPHSDLHPGLFKVPEPRPEKLLPVNIREIDLHIIPGIVFDKSGHRIGYSRGFYDRYLADSPHSALLIGLAYDFQIVDKIPSEAWDIPVHHIISEKRVVDCALFS